MSTPLRVNKHLFQEAEAEGALLNRSAAKQVEFWAKLGKQIAHTLSPADILALMQGIANVHIQIPASQPVNPDEIFAAVDKTNANKNSSQQITRSTLYYEASKTQPGLLDQVMPEGTRRCGRFRDGTFTSE